MPLRERSGCARVDFRPKFARVAVRRGRTLCGLAGARAVAL
jgi:hypothetical protein